MRRILTAAITATLLAACGGGDGATEPVQPPGDPTGMMR
jgi:hypothetical protein